MAILGAVLLILGLVLHIELLWIIGLVVLIIGLVFLFVPIGGTRRRWY